MVVVVVMVMTNDIRIMQVVDFGGVSIVKIVAVFQVVVEKTVTSEVVGMMGLAVDGIVAVETVKKVVAVASVVEIVEVVVVVVVGVKMVVD